MKAEQRKELETNALADRMGHLVQRMKTQPRRATAYYVVGGLLLVIAVVVVWRWYQMNRQTNSERWEMLNSSVGQRLEYLAQKEPATNQGKAARFQMAWAYYWDFGLKRLGIGDGGRSGMMALEEAAKTYEDLAKECSGDKLWEPEALYGLAVIEETKAIVKLDALERAKERYTELKTKYPDSARGKLAAEWLNNAENKDKYLELQDFYQDLHSKLNIIDLNAIRQQPKNLLQPKKDSKQSK
jgi:hypothetical protein